MRIVGCDGAVSPGATECPATNDVGAVVKSNARVAFGIPGTNCDDGAAFVWEARWQSTYSGPLKFIVAMMWEETMRTYALAGATAALFTLPTSAFSQAVEFRPSGVRVYPYEYQYPYHRHYEYGADRGECRELRLACLHKEELGEQGLGNCRRYREVCQGRY